MLLENRVLWSAAGSMTQPDATLPEILGDVRDIEILGPAGRRNSRNVKAFKCQLTTPVEYTRDTNLLEQCAISKRSGLFGFEFLSAALTTPENTYYCFFVPFRRMLGGVLQRIARAWRGKGSVWHRLELMATFEYYRSLARSRKRRVRLSTTICGLDLHLMGAHGEQEIVFVGMNPAQSRLYEAVTDESEDFTLSAISATFCVGQDIPRSGRNTTYFTVDREGVINASAGSSLGFLEDLVDLLSDFERINTLTSSIDRPVYRSRNAQKQAILKSISA